MASSNPSVIRIHLPHGVFPFMIFYLASLGVVFLPMVLYFLFHGDPVPISILAEVDFGLTTAFFVISAAALAAFIGSPKDDCSEAGPLIDRTHETIIKIIAYRERATGKTSDEVINVILEEVPFASNQIIIDVVCQVFEDS